MYLSTYTYVISILYTQQHHGMRIIKLSKHAHFMYYNHRPLYYFLTQKRGNKKGIEIRCQTEL